MIPFAEEQLTQSVCSGRILLICLERQLYQLRTAHKSRSPLILWQLLILTGVDGFQTEQKLGGRVVGVLNRLKR